jgi:hypothetical protein
MLHRFARRLSRTTWSLFVVAAIGGASWAVESCASKAPPPALAKRITSRSELIGGPGALGDVGDYLLQNDQIRVIVQGEGYSRGFGLYGGGLIDADLQRAKALGDSSGGHGFDHFSELFPALFLRAMKPRSGGIQANDGSTSADGSASIVVTGDPADFLFMLTNINDIILGDMGLLFRNEYKLRPGKRYVEITTTVINETSDPLPIPGPGVDALLKGQKFIVPVGDVILFGAGNDIFAPGAGFDMRFTLEDIWKNPPAPAPALPGLVTPFVATRGPNVSYGFASGTTNDGDSYVKRANYPGAQTTDLLVPFTYSAFTGAFYAAAPAEVPARSAVNFKKYFIVGRGDVASIYDAVLEIRTATVGTLSGLVREARTYAPESGASVVTLDANGKPFNQHSPDSGGRFIGNYPPGKYSYRVVADGRYTTDPVPFEIQANQVTAIDIKLPSPGYLSVRVHGDDGLPLPAKCSLVGQYTEAAANLDPKHFLYDLKVGEAMRPTDLIPDTSDASTREYVEQTIFTSMAGDGSNLAKVRPGHYSVVCSHGIEWDIASSEIDVSEAVQSGVDVVLHHVVATPGWVSGDYHLHSAQSVDSNFGLDQRVTQCAAEGLDIALSSDHNYVTDLTPVIGRNGLVDYIQGIVGLELTTLEIGHFNGFPIRYDAGPITKGSFQWAGRKPDDLFNDLRALGSLGPDATVIQVNHPRDALLGYLNDYNWDPDTGEAEDASGIILTPQGPEFGKDKFTYNFDAMEIFNGKRLELMHTYRVPEQLPPPPLPAQIPPAGAVLRDSSGKVAFPGGFEDWYVLLNKGMHFTATGNSDSHEVFEEAGYPRTYTPVLGSDRPGEISEAEIAAAMKSQRAYVTNGPLLAVTAGGKGLGDIADGKSGSVPLVVDVACAPWIDIDTLKVIVNGQVIATQNGDKTSLGHLETTLSVKQDSWVIVEVSGSKSLWPVVVAHEVPPLQIADAVGALASSFGVNLNPFGNLRPNLTFPVTPLAFTNPIYIDFDGDGKYTPAGVSGPLTGRPGALGVTPGALGPASFGLGPTLDAASDPKMRTSADRVGRAQTPLLLKVFSEFMAH